jgi:hypothetical protein
MQALIATHGHCFDGLCSAVVFTRLLRELQGPAVQFRYLACGYASTQPALDGLLKGDVNAILDYRFAASERLDWYFDHHRTAFGSASDREFFDRERTRRPYHYDASYSSCTKLVRDVALSHHGLAMPELEPLTLWADKIDSAAFESAEAALDYSDPVMQLASVVEHHGDGQLLSRLVPRLLDTPIDEVARRGEHRELYRKIQKKKAAFAKRVRQSARTLDRVVLVDLSSSELESYSKFVTYALYPQAMYSVILGRFKNGARINVGYNPWSAQTLDRDLSVICGRYGGGGHPFVGGISFAAGDLSRALDVAQEIALELDG